MHWSWYMIGDCTGHLIKQLTRHTASPSTRPALYTHNRTKLQHCLKYRSCYTASSNECTSVNAMLWVYLTCTGTKNCYVCTFLLHILIWSYQITTYICTCFKIKYCYFIITNQFLWILSFCKLIYIYTDYKTLHKGSGYVLFCSDIKLWLCETCSLCSHNYF